MALYAELSEELEQTNRGVVALYAELDEKSERLRAASESKNRFWANISHELRTPLNSIIGLTRLLAEPVPDAPMSAEQLYQVQLIRNSGSSLLAIVNDLLDVAKAESGQLRIEPAVVQLPALLGRLRALVRPLAENAQITVTVRDEGAPETVLTDELALTSILRNLLSNSIKYTNEGEVRLTVETGRVGWTCVIQNPPIPGSVVPRATQQEREYSKSSTRCLVLRRGGDRARPASMPASPG